MSSKGFLPLGLWRGLVPAVTFTAVGLFVDRLGIPVRIVFLALGAISIELLWRAFRRRDDEAIVSDGELSTSHLDLIVWTALGIPLILGLFLVVIAVASRLGG